MLTDITDIVCQLWLLLGTRSQAVPTDKEPARVRAAIRVGARRTKLGQGVDEDIIAAPVATTPTARRETERGEPASCDFMEGQFGAWASLISRHNGAMGEWMLCSRVKDSLYDTDSLLKGDRGVWEMD